jgi:hypothetical protein
MRDRWRNPIRSSRLRVCRSERPVIQACLQGVEAIANCYSILSAQLMIPGVSRYTLDPSLTRTAPRSDHVSVRTFTRSFGGNTSRNGLGVGSQLETQSARAPRETLLGSRTPLPDLGLAMAHTAMANNDPRDSPRHFGNSLHLSVHLARALVCDCVGYGPTNVPTCVREGVLSTDRAWHRVVVEAGL